MEQKRSKTEAELIATVAKIPDVAGCLRFAERAMNQGMPALAAACEDRAKTLKPFKAPRVSRTPLPRGEAAKAAMRTHIVAEQALTILIDDYKAGLGPTTYGKLARRCDFEGPRNARWFGQVTQLIDIACALAGVPSFALVRVRTQNDNINDAAWRGEYSHWRDRIIARARAGVWTDEDFSKIRDGLAVFSAHGFGHKKAWDYVRRQINVEKWVGTSE
jgi:hypothetical protein